MRGAASCCAYRGRAIWREPWPTWWNVRTQLGRSMKRQSAIPLTHCPRARLAYAIRGVDSMPVIARVLHCVDATWRSNRSRAPLLGPR